MCSWRLWPERRAECLTLSALAAPEDEPGCRSNDDCPLSDTCLNRRCVNPCVASSPCAHNADCVSVNHRAQCRCPAPLVGDPLVNCYARECPARAACACASTCAPRPDGVLVLLVPQSRPPRRSASRTRRARRTARASTSAARTRAPSPARAACPPTAGRSTTAPSAAARTAGEATHKLSATNVSKAPAMCTSAAAINGMHFTLPVFSVRSTMQS